jgi:acetolactate synthase-1/2/3 large subunit
MVRQWQELFFAERFSEVDLSDNPDFAVLARAFGIEAMTIERRDEVESALDTLLAAQGPFLLHVRIDPRANVWPLVPPNCANDQLMDREATVRSAALDPAAPASIDGLTANGGEE